MKISNIIVLFALSFSITLHADESAISLIRMQYKTIRDLLPTLRKQSLELSDYSTDGGRATAFRDDKNTIRLIRVELYGESGKVIEEYYYKNSVLFFTIQESHRYNVPYYVAREMAKEAGGIAFDPKKTKITEDRYYFENGKLIQWINESKKNIDGITKEFKDAEIETLKFSTMLLERLN